MRLAPHVAWFAFLTGNADSLEAGLRRAGQSGKATAIFVANDQELVAANQMKARLGGAVQTILYRQTDSLAAILDRVNKAAPPAVIGFTGSDLQILKIVQGLKRQNPKIVVVGHQGWTSRLTNQSALDGAIIAVPDTSNYGLIRQAYINQYNKEPTAMSFYGFDVVAMAAGIIRARGAGALKRETLLTKSGFKGASGAFRFHADGKVERLFEIARLNGGKITRLAKAPDGF